MAREWRLYWNLKSIVGMGLIGLGLFLMAGNLSGVAAQLSQLGGVSAEATQTFGELMVVGLAASQVWRAYVFDRRELLLGVCRILISFWPIFVVIVGTVLAEMASRTESRILGK
jgi:hypothetical protein